eukprot:gene6733-4827_t
MGVSGGKTAPSTEALKACEQDVLSTFRLTQPTAAVVGAGLAGVHVAYELARIGFDVTVLEQREEIGMGSTAYSLPFCGVGVRDANLLEMRAWRDLAKGVLWRSACPNIVCRDAPLQTIFSPEFYRWLRARWRCLMDKKDVVTYSNHLSVLSRHVVEGICKEHASLRPFILPGRVQVMEAGNLQAKGSAAADYTVVSSAHPEPLVMDPLGWTWALADLCRTKYNVKFWTSHRVEALNTRYRDNTEMISSLTFSAPVGSSSDALPIQGTDRERTTRSFDVVVLAAGAETGALTRSAVHLPVLPLTSLAVTIHSPSGSLSQRLLRLLHIPPPSPSTSSAIPPTCTLTALHPGANLFGYHIPGTSSFHLNGLLSTDTTEHSEIFRGLRRETRGRKLLRRMCSYLRVYNNVDLFDLEKEAAEALDAPSSGLTSTVYHVGVTPDGVPIADFYGGYFNGFLCTGFGNRSPDLAPGAALVLQKLVDQQAQELLIEQRRDAEEHGIEAHNFPNPHLQKTEQDLQQLFQGKLPSSDAPISDGTSFVNPYGTNRFKGLIPPRRLPDSAPISPLTAFFRLEDKFVNRIEPWLVWTNRWIVAIAEKDVVPSFVKTIVFTHFYDPPEPSEEERAVVRKVKQKMERIIQQHEHQGRSAEEAQSGPVPRREAVDSGAQWSERSRLSGAQMDEQVRQFFTNPSSAVIESSGFSSMRNLESEKDRMKNIMPVSLHSKYVLRYCALALLVILCLADRLPLWNSGLLFAAAAPVRDQPPFSEAVMKAGACSVCYHLVMNAAIQSQNYMDSIHRSVISPAEVEFLMEYMCDPYNLSGAWLRRIGFFVLPDNETDENSPVHFESLVLKHYSECKRTCSTVRDICDEMINFVSFDEFPKEVASLSHQSNLLMDENAVNIMRAKFCHHFTVCQKQDEWRAKLNEALNQPGSKDREDIIRDKVEWMDPDRLHIEFSIYKSQNKVEVFTREDIEALKEALAMNDLEAAAKIDEKIRSLTDEEFLELRSVALEERLELAKKKQKEQVEEYRTKQEEQKKKAEDQNSTAKDSAGGTGSPNKDFEDL